MGENKPFSGGEGRAVDLKFISFRDEGGGGLQATHVRSMAKLSLMICMTDSNSGNSNNNKEFEK